MQILLKNSQAGPARTVKQELKEISRNHIQALILGSVVKQLKLESTHYQGKSSFTTLCCELYSPFHFHN